MKDNTYEYPTVFIACLRVLGYILLFYAVMVGACALSYIY